MATYEFIIKNSTNSSNNNPLANDTSQLDSTTDNSSIQTTVKGLVAVNKFVKPFINQAISYRVNTVQLRTGSQELQDQASFAYQTVSHVINFAESVATGWILTGNPIGAVIGGVTSLITTLYGYAQNINTLKIKESLEDISLDMARNRAGNFASYSGSRGNKQ